MLYHRKVMRDEDVGEPKPVLKVAQQVQDLRTDRHVQRRDRLVADDELRLDRERARNGDALALAAGEFVRVAAGKTRAGGGHTEPIPPALARPPGRAPV